MTVLALACGVLGAWAHAQQGNTLSLVVDIDNDGSTIGVEKLQLASAITKPVVWRMPTATANPVGVRRLLFLDVLEVSDGSGAKLSTIIRHRTDSVEVIVPVQKIAANTVRITYQIRNPVQFEDDHAELFWPIGRAWSEPIRSAEINITVPDAAVGEVTAQVVRSGRGNGVQPISMRGNTGATEIDASATTDSFPALELVFAPGVLKQPPFARRFAWFLQANPIVLIPICVLALAVTYRRYTARLLRNTAIPPRYEPPDDLPPAEAGYLIDGRLDPRDFAAMLLDLARRGFIRIESGEPDEGVPYSGPDFVLRLTRPMDNWKGAYPYEHTMLFHTFYGGHWTKLSSLSLRFYAIVPVIERMIADELEAKQLYVDPRRVAAQRLLAAIALIVVLALAQAAGWFAMAQSALLLIVVAVSLVPVTFMFRHGAVAHLTRQGARMFAQLRGFQEFMNSVEADRMQRITPDLFDQYLPYAVALGVEHHWSAAFSTVSAGPPLWWDPGKSGGVLDFVHMVASFSHSRPSRAPSRMTAVKQASTGAAPSGTHS